MYNRTQTAPAALIFDLDDTLIPSSRFYPLAVAEALDHDPRLLAAYEAARLEVKAALPDLHTSARNRLLYFKRMLELIQDSRLSALQVYDRYEQILGRLIRDWSTSENRPALLRTLQARYPTYLLTNETVRTQLAKVDALFLGEPHGFRGILCSEEVGCEKPDARLFARFLSRFALSAEVCLLIGDSWSNDVKAAQKLGMMPIHSVEFIDEAGDDTKVRKIHHLSQLLDILP